MFFDPLPLIICVSFDAFLFFNGQGSVPLTPGRDLDWEEELAKAQCYKCVSVSSDHPLYILYTSGTTGLPKVKDYL